MSLDTPHILCVNPWIHDFAAFDFWAKPLGLLYIASILKNNGLKVSFIDCLDRFHFKAGTNIKVLKDGRGPYKKKEIPFPPDIKKHIKTNNIKEITKPRFSRYGIDPNWFRYDLKKQEKPDLIFVTSLMTYWASGVKETISIIKEIYPDIPVILGGIYASLCPEHAKKNSGANKVVTGNAENILQKLVKDYTNFSFTSCFNYKNLDSLPLPAFDLLSHFVYVPVLTSRGCPFSCEYCASSFLEPKFKQRSPESVFQEINHWHYKYNILNFAFYDDAFLIDSENYAFPFFEKIINSNMNLSFYTPNAIHIKEITKKSASLMFKSGFKAIRLGLETTNFSSSRKYDTKIYKNEFFNAVKHLKNAGFKSREIGAYLLCGLPEQTLEEIEQSIRIVKKSGIQPVFAYYTPIPNTPMWKKAVKNSRFDIKKDPFFTNNSLFPCLNKDISIKSISKLKNFIKSS